ncbi:hypothetical protein TEA_017444 [Camellia sinensis var. sinensis]|uniref:Uncharacterized protein n=1 Tax=Camellia sinensis var. sinensis TaxID=542762 RepID=A0A4S4EHC3_CAMSN|nr:hypothetical protein TEA_017444 [Camellia sinensis var. sinensis]
MEAGTHFNTSVILQTQSELPRNYSELSSCGVPWTEEEHRMFLFGLQKLGKGDWRGISRNYVISRTPTQSVDTPMESHDFFTVNPQTETQTNNPLPDPPTLDEECESMDSTNSNDGEQPVLQKPDSSQHCYPVMFPAYITQFLPFSVPFWPRGHSTEAAKMEETHEVLKPTAVHSKSPINVDELVGMSNLSIGESLGDAGPSPLSLKLLEGSSSRQSAFQANPGSGSSGVNSISNPIHAV